MELNKPVSGVYKITNIKTGKVYIGESVNVVVRIATHFDQLEKDIHVNLELQHDYDTCDPSDFAYELLEECSNKKSALRALESKYIGDYLEKGFRLYNGENGAFLHVKQRREEKKNGQRTKRKVLRTNQRDVQEQSKLLGIGEKIACKANNSMEGNQSRHDANVFNTCDGTKRINKQSTTKRPKTQSMDENGQPRQSNRNSLPPLPPSRHRNETDARSLEDWYLFCDGDLYNDEHPYYCPGAGCGQHLVIPLDDYDDMLYALYNYLPKDKRLQLSDDLKRNLVFFDFSEEDIETLEKAGMSVTDLLNQGLDRWLSQKG